MVLRTAAPDAAKVLTVSALTERFKRVLDEAFPLVWVEGEISNFSRPASGHWYFTLKDDRAQLRCAMFRQKTLRLAAPKNGDTVRISGRPDVYGGTLQLIADSLAPIGLGDLLLRLEALRQKLEAEGLFDPARRRPLPRRPARIGLVTSATGAAVRDVLTTLARRWPLAEVFLYPTLVQGPEAVDSIVRALQRLPRRAAVDVLLLVRGGGSVEDLQAFNDEAVVRQVAACPVPIVVGVGHEIDTSLADYAADLRAPTPTAAAELATPLRDDLRAEIDARAWALARRLGGRLAQGHGELDRLARRLESQRPLRRLQNAAQLVDHLEARLIDAQARRAEAARRHLRLLDTRLRNAGPRPDRARARLAGLARRLGIAAAGNLRAARAQSHALAAHLAALNPARPLSLGFALREDPASGRTVTTVGAVAAGQALTARLADGRLVVRVEAVQGQGAAEGRKIRKALGISRRTTAQGTLDV